MSRRRGANSVSGRRASVGTPAIDRTSDRRISVECSQCVIAVEIDDDGTAFGPGAWPVWSRNFSRNIPSLTAPLHFGHLFQMSGFPTPFRDDVAPEVLPGHVNWIGMS